MGGLAKKKNSTCKLGGVDLTFQASGPLVFPSCNKQAYVAGLKEPGGCTVFLVLAPPAQSNEQTSRHVLDGPKVEHEHKHAKDKDQHKVISEPGAEKIGADGSNSEEIVEDEAHRMTKKTIRNIKYSSLELALYRRYYSH